MVGLSAAQPSVDLALEDFAKFGPGFVTSDTTDESENQDISFFLIDVDGDGLMEIFVSRPDLIKNGTWILYQQSAEGENPAKTGVANIVPDSVRIGMRDGKRGYYEAYVHNDVARMFFNTFDDRRQLVALWEADIELVGEGKDYYDSIFKDKLAERPEVFTLPIEEIRKNVQRRSLNPKSTKPLSQRIRTDLGNSLPKESYKTLKLPVEDHITARKRFDPESRLGFLSIAMVAVIMLVVGLIAKKYLTRRS